MFYLKVVLREQRLIQRWESTVFSTRLKAIIEHCLALLGTVWYCWTLFGTVRAWRAVSIDTSLGYYVR